LFTAPFALAAPRDRSRGNATRAKAPAGEIAEGFNTEITERINRFLLQTKTLRVSKTLRVFSFDTSPDILYNAGQSAGEKG